jgi:hypothetical protein
MSDFAPIDWEKDSEKPEGKRNEVGFLPSCCQLDRRDVCKITGQRSATRIKRTDPVSGIDLNYTTRVKVMFVDDLTSEEIQRQMRLKG